MGFTFIFNVIFLPVLRCKTAVTWILGQMQKNFLCRNLIENKLDPLKPGAKSNCLYINALSLFLNI